MASHTSRAGTKSTRAKATAAGTPVAKPAPAPKQRTPRVGAPQDAAARRRINQRRRQEFTRRVRRLDAVLPSAAIAWRPHLPAAPWAAWRGLPLRLPVRSLVLISALVLALAGLVTWAHTDERWFLYREDARFQGLTYLETDELWRLSEIDGWNLFWLDTEEVRQRLLQNPYVADADVYISPLQGGVTIDVTEAQPVALWVTDNGTRWLLPAGTAVEPRGPTPSGLLTIVDGGAVATAPGVNMGGAIDADVLASAASLVERLPGVLPLRYNRQIGLNFQLPDKPYWVYWGDGDHVERKLENLAAAVQLLDEGELEATVIDVRFERPYVK